MNHTIPLIALAVSFAPANNPAATPKDAIAISELRGHVHFLASPALGGRKPGQPGYRLATEYAARCFREAGLVPMFKDAGGLDSFLQPVPLIHTQLGPANSITVKRNGQELALPHGGKTYLLASPGERSVEVPSAPPVFVGYGIHDAEHGWNDYAGLDIGGRLVVMLDGVPTDSGGKPLLHPEVHRQYSDRVNGPLLKLNAMFQRKAAGVIVVPSNRVVQAWDVLVRRQRRFDFVAQERYSVNELPQSSGPVLLAYPDLIQRMFSGRDYDPLSRTGVYRTFVMEDVELRLTVDIVTRRRFAAHNVVGLLRGSDSNRQDRYVTLSAHLDHLGTDGTTIFPGANDNASGSAAVLELARALSVKRPRRSVIFTLFAAEEAGLLGSLHFVKYPPVELNRILLNINLEHLGRKNADLDGFWAWGPINTQSALDLAARKLGLTVRFETAESGMSVFRGSDNYSFYGKGIPALVITSGGFPGYHSPADKPELIDFEHLRNACLLTRELISAQD